MKTKRLFLMIGLLVLSSTLQNCSSDFLDAKPKGTNFEDNYYQNETEIFNGLIAVYDVVGWQGNGYVSKQTAMNAASDDHFAGGGGANDITDFQVISNYTLTPAVGPQAELWKAGFSGVFRANILLQKIPDVPMDENLKKRYVAEAKFLRAFFYFDLVRLFRNVPLLTEPIPTDQMYDVVQASPEEVYAQIERDLTEAIPDLPATVPVASEGGRATQGAGHALLGKVYLQLERFPDAVTQLKEVNGEPGTTSQYGYKLLDDFNDLWAIDNKFNSESIFEVARTSTSAGNWDCISCTEGNILNILSGPRDYNPRSADAPDYNAGWGFMVVTPGLYETMHYDKRFATTIADLDSMQRNNIATYTPSYQNTGYFLAKFIGRISDRSTSGGAVELNFPQNSYEIRLADTYLMEAEAIVRGGGDMGRAQALYDAVRHRAGMGTLPISFDNIMNERRIELAGEGHRWFDLIRTGRAAEALNFKGFKEGVNEVLPIPLLELSNTKLEQNKEYGGSK